MSSTESRDIFEPVRGVQQSGLRLANERAILTLISTSPGQSSAELARLSGLGPQTVSRILVDLEAGGFVRRGEVRRGLRGQPATPFYLEPRSAFSIGCEIGWRHSMVQLLDMSGNVLGRHRWDYAFPDSRTLLIEVVSLIHLMSAILSDDERGRLVGVGIGTPSGLDRNMDLLGATADDAAGWLDVDIGAQIQEATGLTTFVYNDGNAACWAELGAIPEPRPANFAYFQVSTFIGAGIVAEGTLWEGPTGNSANLGSMIVTDRHGQQNFVHLIASIMALETKLFAAGLSIPAGNPADWDWAALEPCASEWIDDAGRALAKAVANSAAVIEFNRAIIDGIMPRPILERLVESVRLHSRELPTLTSDRPTISMGHLGGAAASRGAAQLPIYRRFFARDWEQFTK